MPICIWRQPQRTGRMSNLSASSQGGARGGACISQLHWVQSRVSGWTPAARGSEARIRNCTGRQFQEGTQRMPMPVAEGLTEPPLGLTHPPLCLCRAEAAATFLQQQLLSRHTRSMDMLQAPHAQHAPAVHFAVKGAGRAAGGGAQPARGRGRGARKALGAAGGQQRRQQQQKKGRSPHEVPAGLKGWS